VGQPGFAALPRYPDRHREHSEGCNNGDITDLDIEAHKLFNDAVAAGHHPCPVDRRIFLNAMVDYGVAAGYIFEYANYSKAGKLIRRGNALINRITDITSEVSG
jgi:hypothetical protein